jgi:hypothetical protein
VTAHPTAEWIAQQVTEAFPWNEVPHCLIRDRDGDLAMGIRDKPIAIRRECLGHMIVFGQAHLRRILDKYVA